MSNRCTRPQQAVQGVGVLLVLGTPYMLTSMLTKSESTCRVYHCWHGMVLYALNIAWCPPCVCAHGDDHKTDVKQLWYFPPGIYNDKLEAYRS
jgi:hypothetical protein